MLRKVLIFSFFFFFLVNWLNFFVEPWREKKKKKKKKNPAKYELFLPKP